MAKSGMEKVDYSYPLFIMVEIILNLSLALKIFAV